MGEKFNHQKSICPRKNTSCPLTQSKHRNSLFGAGREHVPFKVPLKVWVQTQEGTPAGWRQGGMGRSSPPGEGEGTPCKGPGHLTFRAGPELPHRCSPSAGRVLPQASCSVASHGPEEVVLILGAGGRQGRGLWAARGGLGAVAAVPGGLAVPLCAAALLGRVPPPGPSPSRSLPRPTSCPAS